MITLINQVTDDANYYLYNCSEIICQNIVKFISHKYLLINKFSLCASVDSGCYGFPSLGDRVGEYTSLKITNCILEDWPTYSGYYDEWFIFDVNVPVVTESVGLCNWSATIIYDYKELKNVYQAVVK